MTTEAHEDAPKKDEKELCQRFEKHLVRLEEAGRCVWRKEVRMLHWRHAADSSMRAIRIDYVARIDNGPLIGLEAKLAPKRPVDWGRYIKQCADYAASIIGAYVDLPPGWVGKPLHAVFLACEIATDTDYMRRYHAEAARIGSPFRVGFVRRHGLFGLQLTLSDDDRWWCESTGYRTDWQSRNTTIRGGNGGTKLEGHELAPAEDRSPW